MTARARVLFVRPDVQVLVIDRMESLTREQAAAIVTAARAADPARTTDRAFTDVLIFPFELELPGVDTPAPDEQGVRLYADELEAIERLHAVHHGAVGAELRNSDVNALRLLIGRAHEVRA